ncbi:MAG: hypothetical protein FWH27_08245 [Planctomycetaceae bacterium]|nr:hypothetical protein [Planctomycetaceae bacterium]
MKYIFVNYFIFLHYCHLLKEIQNLPCQDNMAIPPKPVVQVFRQAASEKPAVAIEAP